MKLSMTTAGAGVMSLGLAVAPAAAWHLAPSGNFTADGKVSMIKNGSQRPACAAHLTGTVDQNGVGHFTGGFFTDLKKAGCTELSPANLPWKAVAKSGRKVKVLNVTIEAFGTTICGPSTVPVKLASGVISFKLVPMSGNCSVSGHLTTSPSLSILP